MSIQALVEGLCPTLQYHAIIRVRTPRQRNFHMFSFIYQAANSFSGRIQRRHLPSTLEAVNRRDLVVSPGNAQRNLPCHCLIHTHKIGQRCRRRRAVDNVVVDTTDQYPVPSRVESPREFQDRTETEIVDTSVAISGQSHQLLMTQQLARSRRERRGNIDMA